MQIQPFLNPRHQAKFCDTFHCLLRHLIMRSFCSDALTDMKCKRQVKVGLQFAAASLLLLLLLLCLTVMIIDTEKNRSNIYTTDAASSLFLKIIIMKKTNSGYSSSCVFVLQRFAGEIKPATGSAS